MTQIPLSPPNYQNMTSPDQSSVSSNDMGYDFSSLDLLSTCAVERSMSMNRGGSNACGPSTLKDLKSSNSSGVGGKSKSIGSTTSEHSIPGPSNIHNRIQEKSLKSPRKSKSRSLFLKKLLKKYLFFLCDCYLFPKKTAICMNS